MPTSPTPSEAISLGALGASLMEFDLKVSKLGFIAPFVFPIFNVAKQASTFGRVTIESLLQRQNSNRTSGGNYNRGNWKLAPDQYATRERGFEEPIDDREAEIFADFLDAIEVSGDRAMDVPLRNMEEDVKNVVFSTTIFTGNLTTAVTTPWSDKDNSKPVDDMNDAIQSVYDTSGLVANTLAISWKTWKNLKDNAQVIDRIKFSGRDDPKKVTLQALATLFDIEEILVGGATLNTANETKPAAITTLWDTDKAQVFVKNDSRDLRQPTLGRIFNWTADGGSAEGRVEMYRDEKARSNIARARMDTDEKLLLREAGHLLTNIAA